MNIIGDYEAHKRDEEWDRLEAQRLDRQAERQKTCSHKHVLGPTRWTNTSMCMQCGKEFGSSQQRDSKP